jgi:hypothetical protein
MAKSKEVKLSLADQLKELEAKEQTPEVMAEIDALKLQIEEEIAKEKALEEEIARNKAEKEAKAAEKAAKKNKAVEPAFTHEEWRLKKEVTPVMDGKKIKVVDNKPQYETTFKRVEMLKKVIITPEHEDILNEQMENTLLEYVPI